MWAFQYVPTLKAPMGATLHLLHVLLRGVVMWYIRKMSTKLSVKRTCGNSCLLLFPAPQAGCFSCLPAHTVCFSPLHDFFALSLSVDANMFLVFFFLSALSFLSYPRFKSQNNVESFHSNATLSLTPISNCTQTCFFRSAHLTQTVALPVWWTHTQTHTHTERQQVSLS